MAAKGTFGYFFDLENVPRRPGAKAWMSPTAPFLSGAKERGERTPWEPRTGFSIHTSARGAAKTRGLKQLPQEKERAKVFIASYRGGAQLTNSF